MRALVVLLLAGCSATEVDVTLHIAPSIDQSAIEVYQLEVQGAEHEYYNLGRPPNALTQRFIYRSGQSSGTLTLIVSLQHGDVIATETTIGCGETTVVLAGGKAVTADIDIEPGECPSRESDMGVSDGGADLGAPDLAGDLMPPSCIYCDNFEADMLNGASPFNAPYGSEHIISWSKAHSGQNVLQFYLGGGPDGGTQVQAQIFVSGIPPDLWIRGWYMPDLTLPLNGSQPFVRVYDATYKGVTLGTDGAQLIAQEDNVDSPTITKDTNKSWMINSWNCVEWHVDAANGFADLFVNDTDGNARLSFTPFTPAVVNFGLEGDIYTYEMMVMDDLYVAATRIGCSTPTP